MASTANARPYTHLIITPDIAAPDPHPYDAIASAAREKAALLEGLQRRQSVANAQREAAADSIGFNEGHLRNQEWAADIGRGASYFQGKAELFGNLAAVVRDVAARFDDIDTTAHNEIASAQTNMEKSAIIATNNADARLAFTNGIEMVGAHYTYFQRNYGSDVAALSGRLGNLPQDTPGPKQPQDQPGITQPLDNRKPHAPDREGDSTEGTHGSPADSATDHPRTSATRTAGSDGPSALADGEGAVSPAVPLTPPRAPRAGTSPASPLSGGGIPGGFGGGGGLPSGGGGMPGGLSGLGGGNPLSALSSGAGGLSGTPSGLSGVPGSGVPSVPGAGAVDPSAFARGVAAGSGVAGAVPPVNPAPSLPGAASPAAASPVAGAASAAPTAVPAGLGCFGCTHPCAVRCRSWWCYDGGAVRWRDDAAAARYGRSCRARYGRWCGGDGSGDGACFV